jgi:biuret amidohydrolase
MAWQRIEDPDAVAPWFLHGTPDFEPLPELADSFKAPIPILDRLHIHRRS